MPRSLTSPEHLFDRTWRPGHPFRPRLSRWRRVGMALALLLLSAIIGAYAWITDSTRVRRLAEDYLSHLIGGHVRIRGATLSIFQGLRLNDVKVFADETESDDSLLFRAQSFLVRVNGRALLDGKVEATQIVAIEPYVRLTENLDTGKWTHQKLKRPAMPTVQSAHPPILPEVILRNAVVEYDQEQGGERHSRGTIAIEGQLQPGAEADTYRFKLQSRGGESQEAGPSVEGKIEMTTGAVNASLMNFRFGEDLEAMLPAQVREWWKAHDLNGKVEVPDLVYRPASEDGSRKLTFSAPVQMGGVKLVVHPQEFLSAEEIQRDHWTRSAMDAMRGAGLDATGFISELQKVVEPAPITLEGVTGKMVFTESAVDIENLTGYLESNGLKISGRIENYANPSKAIASIRVASMDSNDIVIPASPRYINSMPLPVREIYDHLRPQGHCRFWVQLDRSSVEARPQVAGEIDVLNGSFVFDKFPYPVEGATGKLVFGKNPQTGEEQLDIRDVRGHGAAGGPNEVARVKITGAVSPFGPESAVDVLVDGDDVVSEPMLFSAFPRATQRALRMFDAPGKGQLPKFRGGFTCKIKRPRGLDQHWDVVTNIRLDEADGTLVAFPYPMTGVSGELTVTDDAVKIAHATMKRNGATLQIDGQVTWHSDEPENPALRNHEDDSPSSRMQPPVVVENDVIPPLKPELHIVATNVPIDSDLLSALPADQRDWLNHAGISGRFDLDGKVLRTPLANSSEGEIGFDFHVNLHDAALDPPGAGLSASQVSGAMRLTPGRVVLESITAKRDDADITAHGSMSWEDPTHPEVAISAAAKNLSLDQRLHDALPASARDAWDEVQPRGTLDVAMSYSGALHGTSAPAYEITLTPRALSATPQVVPYRLDDLAGSVTISPQKVVLTDLTGHHGNAKIRLSATGSNVPVPTTSPTTQPASDSLAWDFHIGADDVLVDDDFNKAMPSALTDVLKAISLHGTSSFEFDKLTITPINPGEKSATQPADHPVDVDFAVRLKIDKAAFDVGVPITDIATASAQFSGKTHAGKLSGLDGSIEIPTFTLAGHPATNLKANLLKPPDLDLLRISKIETRVADGEMAGQFDCTLGEISPQRYALGLVLRNADVKQLTGEAGAEFRGRMSASLSMEGKSGDTTSRRGRGDVSVTGEKMYRIPVILGLLQITNLALPITSPFNEATARYSVDGDRVAFENIELRAKDMLMEGTGHLDFGTKQVQLTFVTDNTTWPKLPIIGDLIQGARHELLQIHVKGTLQDPKVTAGAFSTVTTTVDEVLKGADSGDAYAKKKK